MSIFGGNEECPKCREEQSYWNPSFSCYECPNCVVIHLAIKKNMMTMVFFLIGSYLWQRLGGF